MKNLRMMICLAIGGSTALGCVFETSSEPDTTTEGPIAANQGEGSAQTPPALAVYRYQRGKTLMEPPEVRDLSAVDDVTEALKSNKLTTIVSKVEAIGPKTFHMDLPLLENRFQFWRCLEAMRKQSRA